MHRFIWPLLAPAAACLFMTPCGMADDMEKYLADVQAEVDVCDRQIEKNPQDAGAYNRRGAAQFKLGRIDESIADFDKFIELVPQAEPSHWMRGISYYYSGQYDEGREQFEGYQTFDSNDVENAVWRYLCMARDVGVEKAQADILKIGDDRRVPMRQVYELFAGRATAEDVLAAVESGNPSATEKNNRLFYAHLYLGLHAEAAGEGETAIEHLRTAIKHRIGHYMWDVARVHVGLLDKKPK